MLLIRSKVKSIHAVIISEPAKELLENYQVAYTYDKLVPYIANRRGDGMCSMEASVLRVDNLEQGFEVLCQQLKKEIDNRKDSICHLKGNY